VAERFPTMAGRLRQAYTNWRRNNPSQHAEYAADHILQARHHHVDDLLHALHAVRPSDVLRAARRLGGGGGSSASQLHVDMLVYGNMSGREAMQLAGCVRTALAPGGLHPCMWTHGRVVDLSPTVWPLASADWLQQPLLVAQQQQQQQQQQQAGAAAAAQGKGVAAAGAAGGGCASADAVWVGGGRALEGARRGVSVVHRPVNPNPANKNHAIYSLLQVCMCVWVMGGWVWAYGCA